MRRLLISIALVFCASCTTRYQLRGTEDAYHQDGEHVLPDRLFKLNEFVGKDPVNRARQITLEQRSVETFENFSLGVIEISDEGSVNESQKAQVLDMVKRETADGGLLVVFIHGWHHGPRTCDRDLCCFRRVLDELQKHRSAAKKLDGQPMFPNQKVVGVFIGWRGESLVVPRLNVFTLPSRKRVAQRIGRTVGKEILVELDRIWRDNDDLTMVSVGHSLGGAFLYEAMKGKLTGNIFDIEEKGIPHDYRIARARADREEAAANHRKAKRADLGDLVVLVDPAIEAVEWRPFDDDLADKKAPSNRADLVKARLPYDKNDPYEDDPADPQMPVLMVVASKADTAVGRIFPFFRWVQFLVTLRWDMFFKPEEWRGLGHYNSHSTHSLSYSGAQDSYNAREVTAPSCDCPFRNFGDLASVDGFSLAKLDREQDFGGYKLNLTPARQRRGPWDPHSPFFVVSTDHRVISEHSDIFNRVFVGFLSAFINAYDLAETPEQAQEKR